MHATVACSASILCTVYGNCVSRAVVHHSCKLFWHQGSRKQLGPVGGWAFALPYVLQLWGPFLEAAAPDCHYLHAEAPIMIAQQSSLSFPCPFSRKHAAQRAETACAPSYLLVKCDSARRQVVKQQLPDFMPAQQDWRLSILAV